MSKTIKILGIILLVQIVIIALLNINTSTVKVKQKYLSNDTSKVNTILIKSVEGEVAMKRVGGGWRITKPTEWEANPSYMQILLEKLAGLEVEGVIVSNPKDWKTYELDDSSSAYIEVGVEGGKIDKFYVGKNADTFSHTYIRPAGTNEVWLVLGNPKAQMTRRVKDWRNKLVIQTDKALLEKIVIKHPNETVQLVREILPTDMETGAPGDTSWKVVPDKGAPFKPDDRILNRVLNTLSKLNALDFIDQGGSEPFPQMDPPVFTVETHSEGGDKMVLDLIPKPDSPDSENWVVRRNGDTKTLFVIYKSTANNLNKRANELKPGAEDTPTPPAKKK